MSKRRVFDIDFPETGDTPTAAAPEGRRGPMAAAIMENADALAERQAAEAAIRAENDRLAHEHIRLKKAGLIVDLVPVGAIRTDKLKRDRAPVRDDEIDELKASIREVGLSNPIQVEETGEGYELIQGFRRLTAYRELYEETGDERFATIPAGLTARGEALEQLYRRMVDENLVRRDISFAEMAALARSYAADPGTRAKDDDQAVEILFGSARRQKRHYIRQFCTLLEHLGPKLRHPAALPRALGLDLLKRIEAEPAFLTHLSNALVAAPNRTAEGEVALLRDRLTVRLDVPAETVERPSSAKTTFRISHPLGLARCAASDGRLELRLDQDFTAMDRRKLEAAVEAFLAALED